MSYARPTASTLIERARADINGRLPGADSRLRRSLLDVLARIHAKAADDLYGYAGSIAADLMPDTADAEHLDRWAVIWGVLRKVATAAAGTIQISGADGAIVPAGSVLVRADGTELRIPAAAALTGGAAVVTVQAAATGAGGNTLAGATLTFASPSAGVGAIAVVGDAGLGGGGDEEGDAALVGRLLARIQMPPHGGAASDYVAWALAQPDVTRAWVYPLWLGAGTVGVAVVMDGRVDIFPTEGDLDAIAAAIEAVRPVTAAVTVFSPTPAPLNFTIRLTPNSAATRAAVQAELVDLFSREAAPGGTLLISHLREAVAVAAGVNDYTMLVPSADVVSLPAHMPTIGAFTWGG